MHDVTLSQNTTRRAFLGGAASLTLAGILAGCGSSSGSSSPAATAGTAGKKGLGSWSMLGSPWDFQYAGDFVADDRGYFRSEGFSSMKLVQLGASASPEQVVVARKTNVGVESGTAETAAALAQGLKVKVVGAHYLESPACVFSPTAARITSPAQLKGKRVGVNPVNLPVWKAFLAVNHMSVQDMTIVPVGYDITPITSKQVDAMYGFATNQPIALMAKGIDVHIMLLGDFGFATVGDTLVVTADTLANQRDQVKAFLRAEIRGWLDQIKEPSLGVDLIMKQYGHQFGLDATSQLAGAKAQNKFLLANGGKEHGLLMLSPDLQSKCIDALGFAGMKVKAGDLFDMSVLEEIYKTDADLASAAKALSA